MKRYQKLLGPIFIALCAWGAVLGYCAKNAECGTPMREVVEPVSLLFEKGEETVRIHYRKQEYNQQSQQQQQRSICAVSIHCRLYHCWNCNCCLLLSSLQVCSFEYTAEVVKPAAAVGVEY